jgi:hypothetical protein
MHKVEGNTPFGKYAKASWLNGLSVDTTAYRVKWASTGEAGPDGPKSEENSFPNKNWIFKYTKALEICTRRFSRNFDMRIFPKIF